MISIKDVFFMCYGLLFCNKYFLWINSMTFAQQLSQFIVVNLDNWTYLDNWSYTEFFAVVNSSFIMVSPMAALYLRKY